MDAKAKRLAEHKDRFREEARVYVLLHVSEFRRAAEDGRDMSSTAINAHWKALLEAIVDSHMSLVEIRGAPEEHPRPRDYAYACLDSVDALVAAWAMPIVSEAQTRIVRADLCPVPGCAKGRRTCIELEVTYGEGTTRELYFYADTADVHEHTEAPEEK